MTTTLTTNKLYPIQSFGSNINSWGDVINDDLIQVIDKNLGGVLNKDISGGTAVTITDAEAQNNFHILTGVLTANIDYVVPNRGSFYFIWNATTGGHSVNIIPFESLGGGAILATGEKNWFIINPGDSGTSTASTPGALILPLSSAYGGTGVDNAPYTFTFTASLTLAGTGGSTLNIGTGGTLGLLAFLSSLSMALGGTGALITNPSRTEVADYDVALTDYTVRGNPSGGAITFTLPAVASAASRFPFNFKNISSDGSVLNLTGDADIDGVATYPLPFQNQSVTLQSNGTTWDVL